jgi:hypothetical protein
MRRTRTGCPGPYRLPVLALIKDWVGLEMMAADIVTLVSGAENLIAAG